MVEWLELSTPLGQMASIGSDSADVSGVDVRRTAVHDSPFQEADEAEDLALGPGPTPASMCRSIWTLGNDPLHQMLRYPNCQYRRRSQGSSIPTIYRDRGEASCY